MWKKCLYGIVLLGIVVGTGLFRETSSAQAGGEPGQLVVDGLERTFHTYVPSSYDGSQAVPLVVVLHPFGSSGRAMAALTGFDAAAETGGFIVVYPDAYDLGWNDGRQEAGWDAPLQLADDVIYIGTLIDHLSAVYRIDPDRVALAGLANGGSMAYRLACETPGRFTKVTVVGTLLWDFHLDACPPASTPVSMWVLLGSDDQDYPAAGRAVPRSWLDERPFRILSADETFRFWSERNGCELDAAAWSDDPLVRISENCTGETTVMLTSMNGVANNWPRTGNYKLNQFGYNLTDLVARYFSDTPDLVELIQPLAERVEVFGGAARGYVVYVPPSYDPAKPLPLVIALHGRTGNGASMAYLLDMNRLARDKGFVITYPDGLHREWNYVRGTAGYENFEVDDAGFLNTLVDDLAVDLNLDRERLYVTGFSNGAFMVQRMACDPANRFAAFAAVSGTLYPGFTDLCDTSRPVPILFMHGTEDHNVAWDGAVYGDQILSLSAPDTVIYWAQHNGCQPADTETTILPHADASNPTTVYLYTFGGCTAGADVWFYVIDGGGHNLPGSAARLAPEIAGEVNGDIQAADVIWEFFNRYTLGSP